MSPNQVTHTVKSFRDDLTRDLANPRLSHTLIADRATERVRVMLEELLASRNAVMNEHLRRLQGTSHYD